VTDQAAPSATRRLAPGARSAYGHGSPLFRRDQRSRRGPAEMEPKLPSANTASSESVRGERPPSTVAMMAGQASSVDLNRARTVFDGISLSWYATAPSMPISVFSPGLRAYRFGNIGWEKSISGMKNSSSGSSFVRMSFALRGAPCGDDSRPWAASGHYHGEQPCLARPAGDALAWFGRVTCIHLPLGECVSDHRLGFLEPNAVFCQVDTRLLQIPVAPRHRRTVGISDCLRLTP
jgi:hypothetical protein